MKRVFILTFIVAAFACCTSRKQVSDNDQMPNSLENMGLKGKVRSMKVIDQRYLHQGFFKGIEEDFLMDYQVELLAYMGERGMSDEQMQEFRLHPDGFVYDNPLLYWEEMNEEQYAVEKYLFDEMGNNTQILHYLGSDDNSYTGRTTLLYDSLNRMLESNVYDNTERLRECTHTTYDNQGNELEYSWWADIEDETYSTYYKYDERGNRIETRCFSNNKLVEHLTMEYDSRNRLRAQYVFPVDDEGVKRHTEYIYDKKGRITEEREYSGQEFIQDSFFRYDEDGNCFFEYSYHVGTTDTLTKTIRQFKDGREVYSAYYRYNMDTPEQITITEYDHNGRTIRSEFTDSTYRLSANTEYDKQGRIIKLTVLNIPPSIEEITYYKYNRTGQLLDMKIYKKPMVYSEEKHSYPELEYVRHDICQYDECGNQTSYEIRYISTSGDEVVVSLINREYEYY